MVGPPDAGDGGVGGGKDGDGESCFSGEEGGDDVSAGSWWWWVVVAWWIVVYWDEGRRDE